MLVNASINIDLQNKPHARLQQYTKKYLDFRITTVCNSCIFTKRNQERLLHIEKALCQYF